MQQLLNKNCVVARKPRDAAVNSDRWGMYRQLFSFDVVDVATLTCYSASTLGQAEESNQHTRRIRILRQLNALYKPIYVTYCTLTIGILSRRLVHCVQKKNTHSHFLSYLHE